MMGKQAVLIAVTAIALMLAAYPGFAAREELVEERNLTVELPTAISINPNDGFCWIGGESVNCDGWYEPDNLDSIIVRFPPETTRMPGCEGPNWWCHRDVEYRWYLLIPYLFEDFRPPVMLSVNKNNGTCWLAEAGQVLHLDTNGNILHSIGPNTPHSLSVYYTDGSCWVANATNEVMRINSTGSVVWRSTSFNTPMSLSVNQTDGSCWVADSGNSKVVHLSSAGAELWRGGTFLYPVAVSVNSTDGSCWVVDSETDYVVHLSATGAELWRGLFTNPRTLVVNPNNGDCWVATESGLVHLNPDGSTRSVRPVPCIWTSLSVNTADDSVWLTEKYTNEVVNLRPVCSPFIDVLCWHWAVDAIVACYDAQLVLGYAEIDECNNSVTVYRPSNVVSRDQMAVYLARAIAGGEGLVPKNWYPPSFGDVPWGSWAYNHIEYAHWCNVVQGYDDGKYHPSDPVTRDQMAVYIARSIVDPTGEEGLLGYTPPDNPTFPDVLESFWAYKHIEYLSGQDVVKGYDDKKYHPENQVTRDQMAVYITRAFNLPIS